MNTIKISGMRLRSAKRTMVVLLAAVACDVGVTPPAEVPTIAMSLREVRLFAPAGSVTPDTASVVISNNGRGSLEGLQFGEVAYQGAESGWLSTSTVNDTTLLLSANSAALTTGSYSASIDALLDGASNSPRTITVTFEVGRTQSIDVSTNTLAFGATAGGNVPPAQAISITNGGEGILSELEVSSIEYPPNGPQDWLDSSLAETIAPTTLTLTPTSVLQPGTHNATVTISSRVARPQDVTVDVSFEVIDAPQIFLSADQIDFVAVERSTTPITKMVSVAERHRRNIDFDTLLVSSSTWLQFSLDTNTTPAMMTLTADPTGLGPSPRGDSVVVTSPVGGSDTVVVTLAISQGPAIAVSPDTVWFTMARTGPLPDAQIIRIENDSSGTLIGLSVGPPSQSWLRTDQPNPTTAPTSFPLWVDSTGFSPGTETAAVVVTRNGDGARTVTAVFTMTQGPALSLSSDRVDFYAVEGQAAPGQSIEVSNGGDGTLDGVIANSSETWLTVAPPGPSAAPVEVVLEPDQALAAALLPGDHPATVTIISSVASNAPTTIDVVYHVAPEGAPSIALSPDSVRFTAVQNGPQPSERLVEIENLGGGTLTLIPPTDTAGWLSVTSEPPGNPTRLRLIVDPAGYLPGTHIAEVTLGSNDPTSPHVIPAVLTVLPAPTIEFSTDLVLFRGIAGQGPRPDLAVAVTNGSSGLLTLVPPPVRPGWLQSAVLQGNATPTELTLGFNTDLPTLPADSSTVSVVSSVASNSPAALSVEYVVDPFVAPLAAYSPGTVRFTSVLTEALPIERVVEIENVGGGTLSITNVNEIADWLDWSLDATNAPTRLRLTVDTTGYSSDTLTTQVVVSSNSSSSPDVIPVEYRILAGAQIALSANQLALFGVEGSAVTAPQTVLVSNSSNGTLQGLSASARGNPSWLNVDDSSLPDSIIVSIDTVGLATSTYNGLVDVTSSVAGVLPASIAVEFEWLATAPSGNPEISLSPPSVFFTMTDNAVSVGPQYVTVENVGGGTLTVTPPAANPAPWLSVVSEPAGNPTRLRLEASNPNDTLGTYTTTISVVSTDPASPTTIPVSLTFLAGPELALSSDAVTFYADSGQGAPAPQEVAVSNGSGGTLNGITTSGNGPWLDVTPPADTAPTELTLRPRDNVLVPGTYFDTLLVDSPVASNTPDTVFVMYIVGGPAIIGTSSDDISFTSARYEPVPTPHVLMIENIGGGTLDGLDIDLDPAAPAWLDASLSATTAPATVTLTVLTTDLAVAPPPTELVISSLVAETVRVPVSFTVLPGPELAVSSDTVQFYTGYRQGALPAAQVVAVSNQSAGTLTDMTVLSSDVWLDATLTDPGSAPAEITLQPNRTANGLVPGIHTATVSISSLVAGNTEAIVVVYYLDPGAAIALSNDAVDFVTTPTDPAPAPRVVMIENIGTGTLEGLDVNPATVPVWLQAGISPTTAPAQLTLVPNPAALSPGTSETANLEITSSSADPVVLPVTLTVLLGPSIAPSASEISFRAVSGQALPDTQQITVLNGAGGTLNGVYIDLASVPPWLDVTPTVPTAAPTTITVRPNTTQLPAGDSVASLQILSDVASNSPTDVIVAYRVAPGPVLAASPTDVDMTGVSGSSETDGQTVLLENISAGTLGGLTVGNTPSWLTATLDRTDAPAILNLTANPVALPVDTVSYTVTVSSSDAANTADILVTFVVSEPTTLSLSPQTVVFNSIAGETAAPDAQTVSIINAGSGQLRDIGVTTNEAWLAVSLDTNSVPATVTLQPNQVLESRSAPHTADIEATSSTAVNSPRIAYVEYFVQPPAGPVIRLSPQTLTFARDNPPAQTVNISNGGSGTLRDLVVEIAYQGGTDWLFVLLDTRVAPAKLTVSVVAQNAAGAPANAEATIRISGEGAAAQEVIVRLP